MNRSTETSVDAIDTLENISDEQTYVSRAGEVSASFEAKMELVGNKLRFTKDLVAFYRYFLDSRVKWYRKAIVVSALLYFISPVDSIPDLAPLVGYLDDLGVILAVAKFMGNEIAPYYDS